SRARSRASRCETGFPRACTGETRSSLPLQALSDSLVRFSKRDPFLDHELVRLCGSMNGRIERDAILAESHPIECRRENGERFQAQVDAAKERRLDQLQIALVARRELRGDAHDLDETSLRARRASANELEHVRVALLGHDR